MKRLLIFLILLIPGVTFGQRFVAEAPLPAIDKKGFYNIPLPPSVTALLETDSRNIRIIDEHGAEVPYIFQVEERQVSKSEFFEYRMEKELRKGCCTILTFNNERKPISSVVLLVRNARIVKEATMQGSDDKQVWYALKEKFPMVYGNINTTKVVDMLDFPVSNYAYYQVVINDSTTAPLNIISAGYYAEVTNYGIYTELPAVTVSAADSVVDHSTWATIHFDTAQFVDKLEFEISGPPFYQRGATLFQRESYVVKKVKKEYLDPVHTFDITSKEHASIELSLKTPELLLKISNENNPALQIKNIKAWKLQRSLTACRAADHSYKIAVGSDSLQMPVYDLGFFRDSIPDKPNVLQVGEVKTLVKPTAASASPTYFTNRNIIWVAIILVVAVLGTMSVRMLRDKGSV